jgi:acetolactate synthase-1/2/3 large subunit
MNLPGYRPEPRPPQPEQIAQVAAAIKRAKRPVIYAGGGVITGDASDELRELVRKTGIPVTMTLMGLGAFPADDKLCLDMLGMHGSVYANYAVDEADLLIAIGVRFDDRVTGKVAEFAQHGFIVHIDIDPSEINKNKLVHVPIVADVEDALHALNKIVEKPAAPLDEWYAKINQWKQEDPFSYDRSFDGILPQHAISELSRLTADRDTIVTVGVGQHQMWSAQFFKFRRPRTWLSSSGLGTMGFGLPAAMGAKVAHPESLVIDIDGDGSILMNIQEFATCRTENIPVKVLLLNNQHLGMVVQWEDRFFKGNRAHTYLGPIDNPEACGQGDGISPECRYPDFVAIARGFGWQAETIVEKADLEGALKRLIDSEGPALLDVQVPYQEHVLPMIPGGMTVRDLIKQ